MSQEINFSDLNEVQKDQYVKYILENNIPLKEDSQKNEIVAQIKLQTSQKKIINKYTSLRHEQEDQMLCSSPIQKRSEFREYQYNINSKAKEIKQNQLYQSTPNHLKNVDNKENQNIRLQSRSPNLKKRSQSPFQPQEQRNNLSSLSISQKKQEQNINKQNITPQKQIKPEVYSKVLKEVNRNSIDFVSLSDNKNALFQSQNPQKQNMYQSQKKDNNNPYIPLTLRKKPQIGENFQDENKKSMSPCQKRQRATSQYQIFQANGAFNSQSKVANNIAAKQQHNDNRQYSQQKFAQNHQRQEPFEATQSTIKSKETNSKFLNLTTENSLFNKTSKSGNILIVDNSGSENHSQSTSSSCYSNSFQNQDKSTSQIQCQIFQQQAKKQHKMNEIYDILKSVGFCPQNTNQSEWNSVNGGEMRSDPQELSLKLDSKNLYTDRSQDDDLNSSYQKIIFPSKEQQKQNNYQSDYLKVLNQHDKIQNKFQQKASLSPCSQNRGRYIEDIRQNPESTNKYSSQTTPQRKRSSISPNLNMKRDKSNEKNIECYSSNKEYKIKCSIVDLFKNKFNRLTKIPLIHMCSLIEEIYAQKETVQKQQNKYSSKKQPSFKEFLYDYFIKKYKNNQKIAESSLFNLIGSVEYHIENSNSSIAKQFLQLVEGEYSEDQINCYLFAFQEVQLNFKQKSLQHVHLSEKTMFKISLKLFNQPAEQEFCNEIIKRVSQHEQFIKSQTIAAYTYLEILLQMFKQSKFSPFYKQQENCKNETDQKMNKRRNTEMSLSPLKNQKPFSMINESFGIQNEPHFQIQNNQIFKETQNQQNLTNEYKSQSNLKSILQNKSCNQEQANQNILKQTNSFFYSQNDNIKLNQPILNSLQSNCFDEINNQSSPNVKQIQLIQSVLFTEMEKIVAEFIQMFDIKDQASSKKIEDMILKKCKYLITSLILKEQSKWFELLLIDYPNYQQKMQAETIQKLYDAYERSFIQNSLSKNENKNLRSLCKLILKVPELNDAISKLLICLLVPEK
ncbi:hypothetical protein TTHERM_01093680 (macronuclear) [Tetrahymena thermophila SB210]|uniref:Uncharacterized protein n=1 Tax=Tetrahymena thermophila (strain SB210) TaxID=312017 RepID=Q22BM7_TETTS|nr:hypothetical protein TTHERM_01093680 [Tetrahymena thermophila SB210]EAR82702.1 hypothetical protein TTHERM_01093680 [Tetrahymena thermophila SB210]|eukprot:XP_001030365.1 hypothetical protein TTHERM_01093680 [Tetrahymena thermophila SB210]